MKEMCVQWDELWSIDKHCKHLGKANMITLQNIDELAIYCQIEIYQTSFQSVLNWC